MYRHQKLLAENPLEVSQIPEELQTMLADFRENQYDLKDESLEDDEIKGLQKALRDLDIRLYHELKSLVDQEFTEDLSEIEVKESILDDLSAKQVFQIKPTALVKLGYPLKNKVRINEKVGKYRIVKRRYDTQVRIIN